MEFERLKASMINNEQEQPSLYMAICMVESLFMDIEAVTGRDLSACPVGDVKLPVKLIWLCKTIQAIYDHNSDELQRSRARLDQAIAGMHETRAELEKLADVSEQCARAEQEYAIVSDALAQARRRRNALETLEREISDAKQELSELPEIDSEEAAGELARLHGLIQQRKAAFSEQREKLSASESLLRELDFQVRSEGEALQEQQKKRQELLQKLQDTEADISACRSEQASMHETLKQKRGEYDALMLEQETLGRKIDAQREANESFRAAQLVPLRKTLDELLSADKGGRQEKERLLAELNEAKQDKSDRVLQLGSLQAELDEILAQLGGKKELIASAEAQKAQAEKEYAEQNRKLDAMQNAVDTLRKNKETVLTMLQGETARRATLESELSELDAQLERLKAEIQRMDETLPEKEQQLQEANGKYEQLTAAYHLNSTELENRRAQIRELEDQTDKEKLATYLHQLERQKAELEGIRAETKEREIQIERGEQELKAAAARRDALRAEQQKHDDDLRALAQTLKELAPIAAPEFRQSAEQTADRLAQLRTIQKRLSAALAQIGEYLGTPDSIPASGLDAALSQRLQELKNGAEELQKALIQCANSLRLEET